MTSELEEKYQLYALISKNSKNQKDGYLLFMNEERADAFLEIAKTKPTTTNFKVESGEYEKYGFVSANKFIYEKVKINYNFFIRNLDFLQEKFENSSKPKI